MHPLTPPQKLIAIESRELPMPQATPRPRRFITATTLAIALLAGAFLASPAAAAAPQSRRLSLSLELVRRGPVQLGVESGEQRLTQLLKVDALLHSDGGLFPSNPLDAQDVDRLFQQSQASRAPAVGTGAQQQRVSAAQGRQLQADMLAKVQAMQARCGADPQCIARESAALSAAMNSALAGVTGTPAAAPVDDDTGLQPQYLLFTGQTDCKLALQAKIDSRVEGSFNDVQGVVRYTETQRGESTVRDSALCGLFQVVLHPRSGRVWLGIPTLRPETVGITLREESGHPTRRTEGRITLKWWETDGALRQRLLNLNEQGSDVLKAPAGDGSAELRMSWKFSSP